MTETTPIPATNRVYSGSENLTGSSERCARRTTVAMATTIGYFQPEIGNNSASMADTTRRRPFLHLVRGYRGRRILLCW